MLDHTLIEEYCDALAKYGVDSSQAQAVRGANTGNTEFVSFADSIDKVKRTLTSGRGRTLAHEPSASKRSEEAQEPVPDTARTGVTTTA